MQREDQCRKLINAERRSFREKINAEIGLIHREDQCREKINVES